MQVTRHEALELELLGVDHTGRMADGDRPPEYFEEVKLEASRVPPWFSQNLIQIHLTFGTKLYRVPTLKDPDINYVALRKEVQRRLDQIQQQPGIPALDLIEQELNRVYGSMLTTKG